MASSSAWITRLPAPSSPPRHWERGSIASALVFLYASQRSTLGGPPRFLEYRPASVQKKFGVVVSSRTSFIQTCARTRWFARVQTCLVSACGGRPCRISARSILLVVSELADLNAQVSRKKTRGRRDVCGKKTCAHPTRFELARGDPN